MNTTKKKRPQWELMLMLHYHICSLFFYLSGIVGAENVRSNSQIACDLMMSLMLIYIQ